MAAEEQRVSLRMAENRDAAFLFSLAPRLADLPRPPWHTAEAMTGFQARFMQATLHPPHQGSITLIAVATDGERRLGYVHAHPSRDGVTDELCGHVAIIAVEAGAEGKGIAGQLMAAAEAWAKVQGWRLLSIDVFAGNERAIDFYERGGFKFESIRLVKPL